MNQQIQPKEEEKEKPTTNWYLIGGVSLAAGIAIIATATVLTSKRHRVQKYQFEGFEDEASWTEDDAMWVGMFAATKSTFSRMWSGAMKGLKNLDEVIRGHLGKETETGPFPDAETSDKQAVLMTEDDEFYVGNF
jgi:hypothetical protein